MTEPTKRRTERWWDFVSRAALGVITTGIFGLFIISYMSLDDLSAIRQDITDIKLAAQRVDLDTAARVIAMDKTMQTLQDRLLSNEARITTLESLVPRQTPTPSEE